MLLSQLISKTVYTGKTPRGFCVGVGLSLKNKTIRYLFCSKTPNVSSIDFCINASSVLHTDETGIHLSRLHAVFPKNCIKLFPDLPVYTQNGTYLGVFLDATLQSQTALQLITDTKERRPIADLIGCADAIILRNNPVYPIGQRIPAPLLSSFDSGKPLITRPVLRQAIERGTLIKLTLSLPPFSQEAR